MTARAVVRGFALVATGLLAGALGYGATAVAPTFNDLPLDLHLAFHTALMRRNVPVMVPLAAVAVLATVTLAVSERGRGRRVALAAVAATFASFMVTRLGNVPINDETQGWADGAPLPNGYLEILGRWEMFNLSRTITALLGFLLVIITVRVRTSRSPVEVDTDRER